MAASVLHMTNVVVGVAHVGPGGLREAVYALLKDRGSITATLTGDSWSPEWDYEPATWFAAELPSIYLPGLRRRLAELARDYNEDAVALTVGTTELVKAA